MGARGGGRGDKGGGEKLGQGGWGEIGARGWGEIGATFGDFYVFGGISFLLGYPDLRSWQ